MRPIDQMCDSDEFNVWLAIRDQASNSHMDITNHKYSFRTGSKKKSIHKIVLICLFFPLGDLECLLLFRVEMLVDMSINSLRPSDATHICVGKLIIIGSDNGLSPGRRQAII